MIKYDDETVIVNNKVFEIFLKEGALKGESRYIIASEENLKKFPSKSIAMQKVKWAIYETITGNRVSDFFDWITPQGLVKGQSKYFRGTLDKKDAIFTLDGRKTDWFKKIRERGAITGESKYFWAKKDKHYALYHIETGEKLTPDFKSSVLAGAVIGDTENLVYGSFGNDIFFVYDISLRMIVSREFKEETLVEILKKGISIKDIVIF
jgi:hypothetical protein